jgi:exopolyphosphatase / guanosine-5'-triphosphate,3'-diphosphate pyrophosphatase
VDEAMKQNTMNRKVAAIDIGLNATRLLISLVQDKPDGLKLKKEILVRIPLRLGEDCYVQGCISQQRISSEP